MLPTNKRFNKFRGTSVGALIIASVATLTSMGAVAAVVDSGVVNIPISTVGYGIYINFVTGAVATTPPTGWDWNPYSAGGNLTFFWPNGTSFGVV